MQRQQFDAQMSTVNPSSLISDNEIMKMKFPTQDMHSEELSDQNEDFSLVNKGRTTDVEEARRPQEKTKCNCRKRFLTTLIFLILIVIGKIHTYHCDIKITNDYYSFQFVS